MLALVGACGGGTTATAPTATAAEVAPAPPARAATLVTSSIVFGECPGAEQLDPKRASKEIEVMVAECRSVPGGKAHFSATLLPGGKVQLGSPSGDPRAGVIPTCLLQAKAPLSHRIRLSKPCKLDVQLEETSSGG